MKTVVIIGSGIAALAASVRLKVAGLKVLVFESNSYPGGKLSEIRNGEFRFDAGPSLFTMPQFVDELFRAAGKKPEEHFQYTKQEVVCNYFFEDGTKFKAFSDAKKYAKEAARVFDVDENTISEYFERSKLKYDLTQSLFLQKSLHKISTYFSVDTLKAIFQINKLGINSTLHEENEQWFRDPKLIQLFDRYATYNGSTPYKTPGIMSMIPHLEQHFGTFLPKGGMIDISQSIYKLALDLGVEFRFNSSIEEIRLGQGKVDGVICKGDFIKSDFVLCNMDVVPAYRKLLRDVKAPEKILKQERSSSAVIFYWGMNKLFDDLSLHNIFFAHDYRNEFKVIFEEEKIADDVTVYINITSKVVAEDAPNGCENWFVMVNAPGNKGQDWDKIIGDLRKIIILKLSRILQVDIEQHITTEDVLDPRSIESRTGSFRGSLYGSSSNDKFAAFLRHPNFSSKINGLYFCGGSVHPGGGIPLCMLSGKIASELIQSKL